MRKIFCFLFVVFLVSPVYSQSFWSSDELEYFSRRYSLNPPTSSVPKERLRISYPVCFSRIAEFHRSWQVLDTDSVDFGGIIESETGELRPVIQTDNTQEVIWSWIRYEGFAGTDDYEENIDYALDYVSRFPSYNEETSSESNYYPVWNCGLALLLARMYEEFYADTSLRGYADSSARFIIGTPLSLDTGDPAYNILHCFVNLFVAGCLYRWGEFIESSYYREQALEIAIPAKEYIEFHPSGRLSSAVWAMSSGTAVWGLANSYFAEYPDSLSPWLERFSHYLPEMFSPSGEFDVYYWDNSWNIWLANGYRWLFYATGDPLYNERYRSIVDYILLQDTDSDGGVPASFDHPDTMDMTWITAYVVLMGLDGIIDSLPSPDIGIEEFDLQTPREYILKTDTLVSSFSVSNFGREAVSDIHLMLYFDWEILLDTTFSLGIGEGLLYTVQFTPGVDGMHRLSIQLYLSDSDPTNDTISFSFETTPVRTVCGSVFDRETFEPVSGFVKVMYRDTLFCTARADTSGIFFLSLPELTYEFLLYPEYPYSNNSYEVYLTDEDTNYIDFPVDRAELLLLDGSSGEYDSFYTSALDSLGVRYYLWNKDSLGEFPWSRLDEIINPLVLWFFGDDSVSCISEDEQDGLYSLLDEGVLSLLITGQNVAQGLAGSDFLADFFHIDWGGNCRGVLMFGIEGDSLTGGFDMVAATGDGSAGNQNSRDILLPLGSVPILSYDRGGDTIAAVRYSSPGGNFKLVFCGFGLEGIGQPGGLPTFTSRRELLSAFLSWLVPTIGVEDENFASLPEICNVSTFPNPFNGETKIEFCLRKASSVRITVYNFTGERVFERRFSGLPEGRCVVSVSPSNLPSGIYIGRIEVMDASCSFKLVLIK